ncbi:MAG TPA: ester cyclase [Gaiellaceae bacterium]|nr:ester cyclase [Gaiellaceae bacterium]
MLAADVVEARNLSAVRRLCLEVFGEGRLDVLEEVVSGGYRNHNAVPGSPPGREGLAAVVQMVRTAMPDFRYRIDEELAVGDRVAVRLLASGTHTGPLLGIPSTGKSAAWGEAHFFRCEDGVAVEHWGVRDDLGMLQQLGVLPPFGGHLEPHERA